MRLVNLARQPFLNESPVYRLAAGLSLLGVALLFINGLLYWRYQSSWAETEEALSKVREEIANEQQALSELARYFDGLDLAAQNERVAFLNQKIARRTFGWSLLFERLSTVLPAGVRLVRLGPDLGVEAAGSSRRREVVTEPRVSLRIQGQARDGESLLEFYDALFESDAFEDPKLSGESQSQGEIRFNMVVQYLPGEPEQKASKAEPEVTSRPVESDVLTSATDAEPATAAKADADDTEAPVLSADEPSGATRARPLNAPAVRPLESTRADSTPAMTTAAEAESDISSGSERSVGKSDFPVTSRGRRLATAREVRVPATVSEPLDQDGRVGARPPTADPERTRPGRARPEPTPPSSETPETMRRDASSPPAVR